MEGDFHLIPDDYAISDGEVIPELGPLSFMKKVEMEEKTRTQKISRYAFQKHLVFPCSLTSTTSLSNFSVGHLVGMRFLYIVPFSMVSAIPSPWAILLARFVPVLPDIGREHLLVWF